MSMKTLIFVKKSRFFDDLPPFKFHEGRINRLVYVVFESKADRLSQKHSKHTNTASSTRLFTVEA